jgi:hypothetical protein
MGEKLSPAFLNRITAKAQKNAHASAKAEPIISFQFLGLVLTSAIVGQVSGPVP